MNVVNFLKMLGAVIMLASPLSADVIRLGADPWCPYNCEPGSDRPGYMVELAQEALAPFGHQVEYVSVSWVRAVKQAETGRLNGVIGAIPDEAPALLFGPPLGTYEDTVAFRSGETIALATLNDVSGLRIGAVNGYEYYGPVNTYIEAHRADPILVQFASGDDALVQNLRKLAAGRLDIVAEVRAVLEYSISTMGYGSQFEIIGADAPSDIYIAFSPAIPASETYAAQLNEGIEILKANGRYAAILAKYGLTNQNDDG